MELPPEKDAEDVNWKYLLKYFVHGLAFSTLFVVLGIVWVSVSAILVSLEAYIGLGIGLVVLFFIVGFLNISITQRLWFRAKYGFWNLLFHGAFLFAVLFVVNSIIVTAATIVYPGVGTTVATFIIAALAEGFVGKKVAGWWKEEYVTRASLMRLLSSSTVRYIIRRLLYMIPLFIGISIISFFMMYAAGDPINIIKIGRPTVTQETLDAIKAYYGLDKPIPIQYLNWLSNLLHGNFGKSLYGGRPVNFLIGSWFWETVKLQLISILLAFAISIPIGINSAKKQYSKQDVAVTSFSLFGVSMPTFWLGLLLIIVFSFILGWLPSEGAYGRPYLWWSNAGFSFNLVWLPAEGAYGTSYLWWNNEVLDEIAHLVLPVSVLVYVSLAQNVRLIRANMLEALRSDYVLAARASGLSERTVTYKYALRNAISPVITYLGLSFGAIIAGAPMTEYTFNWPGLGRRFVDAASRLDFPVVMGITMIITIMTLVANLIIDISYVYIDPRIRLR